MHCVHGKADDEEGASLIPYPPRDATENFAAGIPQSYNAIKNFRICIDSMRGVGIYTQMEDAQVKIKAKSN